MAVLKCSTCMAPLDVEGTEQFVTCKFCKSRNRVMKTVQGPQLVKVDARGIGRLVFILVLAFVVLPVVAIAVIMVVIGAGTAAVITQIPVPSTPTPTPQFVPPRAPPTGPTKITPSQLPTQAGDHGWIEIDAPGMVGTFASFDPMANLPWATSIAQAWTTDARMEMLYFNAVRPDGTTDLSARQEWTADYRFFSPTRREAQRSMRAVSEQEVKSEFRVMVGQSSVRVLIDGRSPGQFDHPDAPVLQSTCTTAQIHQLMTGAGLPPRPHYDMTLSHIGTVHAGDIARRPGWWRWTAYEPGLRINPQVDATTCALHR